MCKFSKNKLYSVKDIAAALVDKFPGYFKNFDACVGTVAPYIRKNGIKPVNNQSSFRMFSGIDAQTVFDHECEIIRKRTGKGQPRKKSVAVVPVVDGEQGKKPVTVPVKIAGSIIDTVKTDKGFLTNCAGQMSLFDDGLKLTVAIDDKTVINLSPKYAAYLRAMIETFPIIKDEKRALETIIRQHAENHPTIIFKLFDFDAEG